MKKLLKFSASWCAPCKILSVTIERMRDTIEIPIEEFDIDKFPILSGRYGIRSVPTMLLVDTETGDEIKRVTGNQSESTILDFIKN